jgi:hypothetical protein
MMPEPFSSNYSTPGARQAIKTQKKCQTRQNKNVRQQKNVHANGRQKKSAWLIGIEASLKKTKLVTSLDNKVS